MSFCSEKELLKTEDRNGRDKIKQVQEENSENR